jgi:hypothetical protein
VKSLLEFLVPRREGGEVTEGEARTLRTMTRIAWLSAPLLIAGYIWWRASL